MQIDLVVNLPTSSSTELKNNYLTRRTAVDFGVPLLTNAQVSRIGCRVMSWVNQFLASSQILTNAHYLNSPLLQLFKMFAESLKKHKHGEIQFSKADSLFDYYSREKPDETWTSPTEFH